MKNKIIILGVMILVIISGYFLFAFDKNQITENNTEVLQYKDLIRITSELPDKITSPLLITGEARGTWFFEGDFPVILTNWDGLIIAEGIATTGGEEWMTEEYIPFTASVEFEKPDFGERGSLIFQKDNPTGKSEFDDAFEIAITF